ncbi:dihydrofolate reductase family protein [Solicola gregarius]|uniref:Dihydrofolate reductase family protein n=1 Tax=Solicola gregarius TaxID=2908642 RepID=A0AA46TGJ5_9ACTN|nr:dihydrofolate reductase family protein [Solicola gregarius]UYM04788.1 dihydrofolate reductase family protein [Solicola gregarius]
MMTTLNGRLDDPDAWVTGVSDDHYWAIDRGYSTFDTILVGRRTYEEMAAFWPGAGDEPGASAPQQSMARRMSAYQKYVFSSADSRDLGWTNTEGVRVRNDDDIRAFATDLTAQPGGDIHLSGGATLAQTFVRLGLVDEYRFFVYPVVSKGMCWYDQVDGADGLELRSAATYDDGVAALTYKAVRS